jgi:beta-1,4-mannosyltransferase
LCSPRIVFQITTKGREGQLVQKNIDSLNEVSRELGYDDYEIHVVTDGREKYEGCTTLNVPEDYTCRKAVHKGRAFQYALEYRRQKYGNLNEFWILHLDEESQVTRNVVMACVDFIEKNPSKLIAEGAINYPIKFLNTQLLIPSLLEAERSFGCYFCCTQMNLTPVWLHGSNLLVRADLEDEIGWEADSIAEDACFGYRVANSKGNVFGWTHGTLLEQPAFTIKDCMKQRIRWYRGSIQNMQFLSWKKKILQYTLLGTWKTGFFATFIGLPALLGYLYVPEYVKPLLLFNLTFWLFSYVWGTWLNIRHLEISREKKATILFYCALISPLLGFFSTLPAVMATFTRPRTFEIVRKS